MVVQPAVGPLFHTGIADVHADDVAILAAADHGCVSLGDEHEYTDLSCTARTILSCTITPVQYKMYMSKPKLGRPPHPERRRPALSVRVAPETMARIAQEAKRQSTGMGVALDAIVAAFAQREAP